MNDQDQNPQRPANPFGRLVRRIWCCGCNADVDARLTDGREVYPYRSDLSRLPFWKCDDCRNFVGCHHKTSDRTRPLGCIPTPAIKRARMRVHSIIDPIWKSGRISRSKLYAEISKELGRGYHTGEIRSEADAKRVCEIALKHA